MPRDVGRVLPARALPRRVRAVIVLDHAPALPERPVDVAALHRCGHIMNLARLNINIKTVLMLARPDGDSTVTERIETPR